MRLDMWSVLRNRRIQEINSYGSGIIGEQIDRPSGLNLAGCV